MDHKNRIAMTGSMVYGLMDMYGHIHDSRSFVAYTVEKSCNIM